VAVIIETVDPSELLRPFVPRLLIQWLREWPGVRDLEVAGSLAFVDISGFTKLTERLATKGKIGAEELNDVLDAVFGELLAVAYADGAGLIKWGGDAVLLLFEGEDHAARACRAAYGMRRTIRRIGRVRTSVGEVVLRMSIGIHSGTFNFFLVGDRHFELVITGPGATQTALMEGIAEAGEIAISKATASLLPRAAVGEPKEDALLLAAEPKVPLHPAEVQYEVSDLDLASCIPVAIREHLLDSSREPEHRAITVAFIEFSRADDLLAREGPEALADELDHLFKSVQAACEQHQVSFFETDISKDGGKIMLIAGAPRSAGDDEERVLRLARRVVDEARPGALSIRIGINNGHVFVGDFGPTYRRTYSVKGDAVNLAARVMGKAEPGQILATPSVLDRSPTMFETTRLEPFMAKGKKHPVQTFAVGRIVGSVQEKEQTELPLVGRDQELLLLSAALDDARVGQGRVVELVGSPGIGKTRLLAEVFRLAEDFRQVTAACEPYQVSTPYHAFMPVLRAALGFPEGISAREETEFLRTLVSGAAPSLAPWLPLLALPLDIEVEATPEVDALDPQFRKQQLETAVEELLHVVVDEPTLFAIEDVHWIDEVSRDLLIRLSREVGSRPWVICVTRRDEQTGFVAPEGHEALSLHPTPLGPQDAERLLAVASEDQPLRPDEIRSLAERAGGNPLFLKELLIAARHAGSVEDLPDSVEALVMVQIDRLTSSDRRLLRYASVLGAKFTDELLEELFEGEAARVLDEGAWERLAEFLAEESPGVRRFRHALMRDAAYEGLTFRRRRELHARAAEAIVRTAEMGPETFAELLSLHFFNAQRYGEAWGYSRIAGDRGNERYANTEAAVFYRRAIESAKHLDVEDREIASLYESLGDVRWRMSAYREALAGYAEARRLLAADPAHQANLLLKEAKIPYKSGRFSQSIRAINKGLAILGEDSSSEVATVRARLMSMYAAVRQYQGKYQEAERWCLKAIEYATQVGAKQALAHAYDTLNYVYMDRGRIEEAIFGPLALALHEERGDLFLQAEVLNNMGVDAYDQGRWTEAVELYERSRQLRAKIGDADGVAMTIGNIAEILSDRGLLDEAEEMFRQAVRVYRSSDAKYNLAIAIGNLGRVAARSGRFEEGLRQLRQSLAMFEEMGERSMALEEEARIAEAHLFAGDWEHALAAAGAALATADAREGVALQVPLLHRIRGYALMGVHELEGAGRAFGESLDAARARQNDYEIALTLDAITKLTLATRGEPDADLAAEARDLFDRLAIVRLPEISPAAAENPDPVTPGRGSTR
jgi:class 3 adenylate cyclase/tetratricopeptide (TPR) repeat protein